METLKIWLDDVRPAPEGYRWVKTHPELVSLIEGRNITGQPIEISFDHDLGDDEKNGSGYTVARYLENCAGSGKTFNIVRWEIHSANPVGAKNIRVAMESFERIREGGHETQ